MRDMLTLDFDYTSIEASEQGPTLTHITDMLNVTGARFSFISA